jgi:hypothetical protein
VIVGTVRRKCNMGRREAISSICCIQQFGFVHEEWVSNDRIVVAKKVLF